MCCKCIAVNQISPLLVFPRIDIIQWLDGFINHVENTVNITVVYGQIKKH